MMTDQEGIQHDRLARGEAVPGGPGACDRDGCAHLTLWHGEHGRYRKRPCRQCGCPAYVAAARRRGHPRAAARRPDPVRHPAIR